MKMGHLAPLFEFLQNGILIATFFYRQLWFLTNQSLIKTSRRASFGKLVRVILSVFWRLQIKFQQWRKSTLILCSFPLFYSVCFIPRTKIPQLVFERLPCEFKRVSNLEHAIVQIKLLIFFKVLLNWTQIPDLRGLNHSSLAGTMLFSLSRRLGGSL